MGMRENEQRLERLLRDVSLGMLVPHRPKDADDLERDLRKVLERHQRRTG